VLKISPDVNFLRNFGVSYRYESGSAHLQRSLSMEVEKRDAFLVNCLPRGESHSGITPYVLKLHSPAYCTSSVLRYLDALYLPLGRWNFHEHELCTRPLSDVKNSHNSAGSSSSVKFHASLQLISGSHCPGPRTQMNLERNRGSLSVPCRIKSQSAKIALFKISPRKSLS
jgi:hypothetical protein